MALKFLAADRVEDEEHKARFRREARAAAALDHPNICTVYEIDEAQGQTFLAMPYLEGSTVRQKVKQRPLKLAEALDIAIQAGEGLRAAHEKTPRLFPQAPFSEERHPAFSPDGRWLAHSSDVTGRGEIYVQAYPGPGGRHHISTDAGQSPAWAPSGRELFYRNGDKMMAVDIKTDPTFLAGRPHTLFEAPYGRTYPGRSYDVTRDGRRFLMIPWSEPEPVHLTHVIVVLNWFEELKRLAPADD